MKLTKSRISSFIFLVVIVILVIPQTRTPIQIVFHKLISKVRTVEADMPDDRMALTNYDWQLIDASGNLYDFNEAKEKVVLINFWATWCPPCIVEMPSMQKLYDTYQDKIVFLFVTNDDFDLVKKFNQKNDYTFKVYRPKTDSSHLFDVKSIPRTFVIDKSGKVAIDKSGAVDWYSESVKEQLDELLKQ
ncbi:TlpA family protein disulfide reductase [Winogradskyella sp. A3E31]|uniref:TlpA family protein disulfide reductase n=1 Tax=Winogradskyella sp. A3E31 TaxID=3349637 RepID=UPI00398B58BB